MHLRRRGGSFRARRDGAFLCRSEKKRALQDKTLDNFFTFGIISKV